MNKMKNKKEWKKFKVFQQKWCENVFNQIHEWKETERTNWNENDFFSTQIYHVNSQKTMKTMSVKISFEFQNVFNYCRNEKYILYKNKW